jgi:hypothetical protein
MLLELEKLTTEGELFTMRNLWDHMRQGLENSFESVAIRVWGVLGESIQAQLSCWIGTKLKEVLDVDEQDSNCFECFN